MTTITKDSVLEFWDIAKQELVNLRARESALRKEVISAWYPTHRDEGTENIELAAGWKLKAVFKQNYEFDKDKDFSFDLISGAVGEDLNNLWVALTKNDDGSPNADGEALASELFKVNVSVNATTFKKLPPSLKSIVAPYVTIKEASTDLSIVAPKTTKTV